MGFHKNKKSVEYRTDIISSSRMNTGKRKRIDALFRAVRILKNKMSLVAFELSGNLLAPGGLYALSSEYKKFRPSFLSAWETQALWHDILGFYQEKMKAKLGAYVTREVQKGTQVSYYKVNTKKHSKGEIKSYKLVMQETPVTKLVKWLAIFDIQSEDSLEYLEKYEAIHLLLSHYKRNKPAVYDKAIQVAQILRTNALKDIKPIVFKTGSHRRAAVLGQTIVNEILTDETNTKFQTWYRFNLPNEDDIYFPLEHSQSFHGDLSQYNLRAVQTVTFRNGKLRLGLLREAGPIEFLPEGKSIGFDVGFSRHFLAGMDNEGNKVSFKSDSEWIAGLGKKLLKIDQQLGEADKLKANGFHRAAEKKEQLARRRMANIVEHNQWCMESLVSEVVKWFKSENYSDIAMEDLKLHLTDSSLAQIDGLKLTRLVRMLKLSSFKEIFKAQCEKVGIRIHTVHAEFSSQECPDCHHIERLNRNGDVFKCKECGFEAEADINGGCNLLGRLCLKILLDVDEHGRYSPKIVKRDRIKEIVSAQNKPYPQLGCSDGEILVFKPTISAQGGLRCFVPPEDLLFFQPGFDK